MKLSKYTFLFAIDQKKLIYNTISNALLELDDESFEILRKNRKNRMKDKTGLDEELYEVLLAKQFIAANDEDLFLEYKSHILHKRNSDIGLTITVAPTMDCNYACPYCFEDRREGQMSDQVIEGIVNFVKKHDNISDVDIQWFGGEPLLAIDKIQELYNRLKSLEGKNYASGMITNGYLLNEKNIRILKEIEIGYLQVTLDGMRETHNKNKFTKDCKDTFSVTIQNLDILASIAPGIKLNIRININKENATQYVTLHNYLVERYAGKINFSIAPGIVQDFDDHTLCPSSDSCLFSLDDVMKFGSDMYNNHLLRTTLVQYPSNYFQECGVRNKNVIAFDPEGYAYKCWEIIGNKKYAVGKLNMKGVIADVDYKQLNRYLYGADPLEDRKCQACAYLPICNGGCPHHRIETKFNGKHMDTCTFLRGNIPELMRIHLDSIVRPSGQPDTNT